MKNDPPDSYSTKEPTYYQNVRREILPFLQLKDRSVLEVGCGEGATLRYLKDQCGASWVGGIEAYQPAAMVAAQHLDWISINDIESPEARPPTTGSIYCYCSMF
jgi:trans-aconitate methyltransferase